MTESAHLNSIMDQHNRAANLQVVFVDVEKYSKRRTLTQIQVIDALTAALSGALSSISKEYVEYAQTNSINFRDDIIRLPTGDGAAIVFSFDGLHDIHLKFGEQLLKYVFEFNRKNPCEKFDKDGWCNCHANFNLRIGVSEGRGIVYRDLNNNFNIAGGVINMAARVMNLADRAQILFTDEAFRQIVDMVDDPHMVERFQEYRDIRVKHRVKVTVHQYLGADLDYINGEPPADITVAQRIDGAMERLSESGFPSLDFKALENLEKGEMALRMEKATQALGQLGDGMARQFSELSQSDESKDD